MRSKITVIAQDPSLFKGSLKFNLDPFNEFEPSAIEELLINAQLQDLINREPDEDDAQKRADTDGGQQDQTELTS